MLVLEPLDRAWLHQRIETRFHQMLEQGLVEEVIKRILSDGLTDKGMSVIGSQITLSDEKWFAELFDKSKETELQKTNELGKSTEYRGMMNMLNNGAKKEALEMNKFFLTDMTDPARLGCSLVGEKVKTFKCD